MIEESQGNPTIVKYRRASDRLSKMSVEPTIRKRNRRLLLRNATRSLQCMYMMTLENMLTK